jgi:hypothetical protein
VQAQPCTYYVLQDHTAAISCVLSKRDTPSSSRSVLDQTPRSVAGSLAHRSPLNTAGMTTLKANYAGMHTCEYDYTNTWSASIGACRPLYLRCGGFKTIAIICSWQNIPQNSLGQLFEYAGYQVLLLPDILFYTGIVASPPYIRPANAAVAVQDNHAQTHEPCRHGMILVYEHRKTRHHL